MSDKTESACKTRDEETGGYIFSAIELDGKPLADCDLALDLGTVRFYVSVGENSFAAIAVSFVCCDGTHDDIWQDQGLVVNRVFECSALFDGVRHMFWGNDGDDGYLYYPDIESLAAVLAKLREIEKSVCARFFGRQF